MGLFKSSAKKHIEGHKELTKHAPIIRLEEVNPDACKKLYFPTMAPNGKPMTILVKEGDTVCVGTKIAERTDFYVPVYSPVSGKVLGIEDCFSSTIGRTIKHIVIENDFRKEKQLLPTVTLESSKEELFAAMKEAGLVGMGTLILQKQ